jgi:hypothetical protein
MNRIFSILLFLIAACTTIFSQKTKPSTEYLSPEKYKSETIWSCIDKHFGYFIFDYSKPISFNTPNEKILNSGSINLGYLYRYKFFKFFDIGLGLNYSRNNKALNKNVMNHFDPSGYYDKIKIINNNFLSEVFMRITYGEASYNKLGFYLDLGGYFSYTISAGTFYSFENKYIYEKIKFKNPEYLNYIDYGAVLRLGYNKTYLKLSLNTPLWIESFNGKDFQKSLLNVGFGLNLF